MSHEEAEQSGQAAPAGEATSAGEATTDRLDANRLLALERACERGLREQLPGFEIVDRQLALAPRADGSARNVDLLGVDGSARAVLVVFSDGASDDDLLVALESVAFARTHAQLLAQHVRSLRGANAPGVRRAPMTVLIAESFTPRLLGQLALLPARELALFEVVEVQSGSRSSLGFRPVELSREPSRAERTVEQFVASLPPDERAPAEMLVRRLPRLDDRLRCTPTDDSLVWRLDERDLCRLDRVPEGLVAWDAAAPEPFPMRTSRDVDEILERLIRGSRALPEKPASGRTQLLSADEIAAFRDP